MRLRFVLVLLMIVGGCAETRRVSAPVAHAMATPRPEPATLPAPAQTDDEQVLEIALLAFAVRGDGVWLKPEPGKERLVVHHETVGKTRMLGDRQLDSDVRKTGQATPPDVAESLRKRNGAAAPLAGLRLTDRRLSIANLDDVYNASRFDRDELFRQQFPDAFAEAHAWLPGFSHDGNESVVRFWFGPTPHGATATFYLRRHPDGWKIKWYSIAHYV